ncbi:MAG: ECF transporter S component [Methanomicrobiales archaeon]|nr:ECF transporter S component [Methanomicrobiales archaeon]
MTFAARYFSLHEIALLSLCGALVFLLKTALKVPVHLPGNSGILWVLPLIVATAIVQKPGSATYAGFVSGILASFFGTDALHILDLAKYLAMGMAIDLCAAVFSYRVDHPVAGFICGAAGNLVKMVVNYAVQLLFGIQAAFIVLGIGVSSATHLVFGGIGGIIAALLIRRLKSAGVIAEDV